MLKFYITWLMHEGIFYLELYFMNVYRNFREVMMRVVVLAAGSLGLSRYAEADEQAKVILRYIELKDAVLLTPGTEGLQVVRLADQQTLRIEWHDLVMREGRVFVREELLPVLPLDSKQAGDILEIARPENALAPAPPEAISSIVTALGTTAAAVAVTASLDDLSDDMNALVTASSPSVTGDASDDEALDAEEDEQQDEEPETPVPAPVNTPPTLATLPETGAVSESAATGTLVGLTAQADDPENTALVYSVSAQEVEGAFDVNPSTGEIRVLDESKLDFESHSTLSVTIRATDAGGAYAEQTTNITLIDDPTDTINTTAINTLSHTALSSGAFVQGLSSGPPIPFGLAGIEKDSGTAFVEYHSTPTSFLMHDALGFVTHTTLTAPSFTALPEINAASLSNGYVTLSTLLTPTANGLIFSQTTTDFSALAAMTLPLQKVVDRDIDGVVEETFTYGGNTVTKADPSGFTQTDAVFGLSAGDIIHFADLTGDGLSEVLIKESGVGEVQVYQGLESGFETEPMAESAFTGIDLDALAGGRALDFSLREHNADGNLTLMLLGETQVGHYEFT